MVLMFSPPKDALCQVWLKLAQWFWRRRFLNFINVFLLFSPLEKDRALKLKKMNFFHLMMLYAKISWKWPSGSGRGDENVKTLQTDG